MDEDKILFCLLSHKAIKSESEKKTMDILSSNHIISGHAEKDYCLARGFLTENLVQFDNGRGGWIASLQTSLSSLGGNGDNEALGEVGTKSEGEEEETLHLGFEVYNTTFSWIACDCDFRLYIPNTDADERHIAKKQYHIDKLIFSLIFCMS